MSTIPSNLYGVSYFPQGEFPTSTTSMWKIGTYSGTTIAADFATIAAGPWNVARIFIAPTADDTQFRATGPTATQLGYLTDICNRAITAGITLQVTLFNLYGSYGDIATSKTWAASIIGALVPAAVSVIELQNEIPLASTAAYAGGFDAGWTISTSGVTVGWAATTWAQALMPYLRTLANAAGKPVICSTTDATGIGVSTVNLSAAVAALVGPALPDWHEWHVYQIAGGVLQTLRAGVAIVGATALRIGETGLKVPSGGSQALSLAQGGQMQADYIQTVRWACGLLGLTEPAVWSFYDIQTPVAAWGMYDTSSVARPVVAMYAAHPNGTVCPAPPLNTALVSPLTDGDGSTVATSWTLYRGNSGGQTIAAVTSAGSSTMTVPANSTGDNQPGMKANIYGVTGGYGVTFSAICSGTAAPTVQVDFWNGTTANGTYISSIKTNGTISGSPVVVSTSGTVPAAATFCVVNVLTQYAAGALTVSAPTFSMSGGTVTLQYLVAFNNAALDSPTGITSIASHGALGAVNVWTDITAFVAEHDLSRGRQHELDTFEAGTLVLQLNNVDGRFSPWNTAGPYTGLLTPRKQVQVRATSAGVTYYRFTGHVTSWVALWDDPISEMATCNASDAFRLLSNTQLNTLGYPQQVLADGASAYWRLGESSGSVAVDSSPNADNGTYGLGVVQGIAGALAGDVNAAAQLGIGGTVTVPANAHTTQTAGSTVSYSIEGWVRIPSGTVLTAASGYTAAAFSYDSTAGVPFGLGLTFSTAGIPSLYMSDPGLSGATSGVLTQPVTDGNWHHLALTYTGSTLALVGYVDGQVVATYTSTTYAAAGTQGAVIGAAVATLEPPFVYDEVAFYAGVALTAAQVLNHYQIGTVGVLPQASGGQIGTLLNAAGWSMAARNVDAGTSTLQGWAPSAGSTVLAGIQTVEKSEHGQLFMDAQGRVRFVARANMLLAPYTVSQATFGDNPAGGELPFNPAPTLGIDDLDLYNDATAQRVGGVVQETTSASSVAVYGTASYPAETGLLIATDLEVQTRTQWIVGHYALPLERLATIIINLTDDLVNLPPAVLGRELMDRVTVNRHGTAGGPFTQVGLIESIAETVTPDSWQVTLALSPADTQSYWILGDAVSGVLGTTTRLAY